MGPKTVRAKTLDRLASLGIRQTASAAAPTNLVTTASQPESESSGNGQSLLAGVSHSDPHGVVGNNNPHLPPSTTGHTRTEEITRIPLEALRPYLDIAHNKLYQVWPVFDIFQLLERLAGSGDVSAQIVALSICTATILQLQLMVEGSGIPLPQDCIQRIEDLRSITQYRRRPTIDSLLTSFFLHVSYLHVNQQAASTLLLRESITMAHLLELHQPGHYVDMDSRTEQTHLRIVWLLFITERAHARQYDLPSTLTISSALPSLQQEDSTSAFTSLCGMFACFDGASHADDVQQAERQLQMISTAASSYNSIQQADLAVTREWMRLLLWKDAVADQTLSLMAETPGSFDSVVFPVQVARDLLSSIAPLSVDALEAHGAGMELKLFSMATSLADVVTCVPTHAAVVSQWGAVDCLVRISDTLHRFRGGTSEAVISVLRERFVEIGLNHILPGRKFTEHLGTPASDESESSETTVQPWLPIDNRIFELDEDEYD